MPIAKRFTPLLIALTLAGCAAHSTRHRVAPLIAEADSRFRAGDYAGASHIYQRLAEDSNDADYYRLLAADAELRVGNMRAAQALLGAISPDELEAGDKARYLLLRSRIDLNQGKAREAMARLDKIDYQRLTTPLKVHYHTLRASAYNQLGNMLESARERIYYGQLINNPEAVQKNNEAIYDALNRMQYKVLTGLLPNAQGTLRGWMALVIALRSPETNRIPAVKAWQKNYPSHPANGSFAEAFLRKKPKTVEITPLKSAQPPEPMPPLSYPPVEASPQPPAAPVPPAQPISPASGGFIGVMLPLTGPYAPAAQAIRSGMMAAWNADTNPTKPELRFVDIQGGDVATLYQKQVNEGARFIVGPLLKEEVAALGRAQLSVPVLALNQSPDAAPREGFYQFALTPEQEVEQAASLAWFDGRQNALVLAPASAFGQRMVNHFSAYWKTLGGKVVTIKTYQPGGSNYALPAQQLLASLGDPASISTGAHFIFLIADSRDGRLLNPHLENQQPAPVPVYATSHIFNGQPGAPQNQDLSGVIFCDIPWLLNTFDTSGLSRQALQGTLQQIPETYMRLLPMGIDAYQLVPQLNLLKSGGLNRYSGATGVLSVQAGNHIQRQLHCAQFEGNGMQPRGIAPTLHPSGGSMP
ncbi:MAG: penicillin-binding protein activator [Methylococcaceae bacterium]|nr:penicillin-binding protein activator [Methylococcaceae bacterium]